MSDKPKGPRRPEVFGDLNKGTIRHNTRWVVRRLLYIPMRLLFGLRFQGLENIPPTGPFILISNHLHNFDPLMTHIALTRSCHFFVKREAFKVPVFRTIAYWTGGFPVDRGTADRWAIRRAEATLKQGIGVGIYPEGTRSTTMGLQKGFAGAGLVALRSGAPIVPSVVTGSERMPFNGKKGKLLAGLQRPEPGHKGVLIRFGEPFTIPREIDGHRLSAEEATDYMMIELAKMLPPGYRGIYADHVSSSSAPETPVTTA